MCGLVAWFGSDGAPAPHNFTSALKTLSHRGPDGIGSWMSPDRSVALGHTRLAVVDMHTGEQPVSNEDSSIYAIVNGEFYDFERLRHELQRMGHKFKSSGDSEILIHLYEEYGLNCLKYLRGEFAFVLWDKRNRQLFAARDRFGIKPLCWALNQEGLSLASEAKALLALGIRPAWDTVAFMHAACHQYLPQSRTLFKGISALPPACGLLVELNAHATISESDVHIFRYWDINYPEKQQTHTASLRDTEQFIRAQLEEAVRLRMRADVPIACYLSGGIDSAAVLSCATKYGEGPIDCFTASFEGEQYDEQSQAEEVAAAVSARLHTVRITQNDILDSLPDAVWFSEGLAVNGHLAAKYLLSNAVRKSGYKVVLTGEGADEAFLGYSHLQRDYILALQTNSAEAQLAQLYAENISSAGILLPDGVSLPLEAVRRRLGFIPSFIEAKATIGNRVVSLLTQNWHDHLNKWDPFDELLNYFDIEGQLRGRHPVEQSAYLWTRLALPSYVLRMIGDGAEMANSVEGRLPFLDHHLFEAVRDLPLDIKIGGGIEKRILRDVMRPWLPEHIVSRRKRPFISPPVAQLGGKAHEFFRDMLGSDAFAAVPFFEQKRVLQWLDELETQSPEAWAKADPALMMAICSCILQERFGLSEG